MRSAVLSEEDLKRQQDFFDEFIPRATEFISKEVRVGVPSGRILDVMGTELRFVTSCQLIQRFVNEFYRTLVRDLLENEATLSVQNGKILMLRSVALIISASKKFLFETLKQVIERNKLQPVLETLD
jgi:hypothetical protein